MVNLYLSPPHESPYYPCLCLCFGLQQITMIRLRLRISRHFSHILRMEARIFIAITLIKLGKSIQRFDRRSPPFLVFVINHIVKTIMNKQFL